MTIINTSPDRPIQLGYEGEDKVTILRFSYSKKWLENGEGIFTVRVLRNGEKQAYNAQVIKDDRENLIIDMTVTDIELSKRGYGEMQLVYTGADFVKKSPVYKYYVNRSVDEAVDPPESDVYTQLIENLADLRVDFNELSDMVSEVNEDIGDLTGLTTANKLNIVESINEVNAKKANTQDVADTIHDLETDIGTLKTDVQGKADIQTVSALADAVQDLDGDVQGLQTTVQAKADTATVTALSGTVSGLQTAVQSKADAQTVTALSGTVTGLQTSKADKSYVDTQLATKASTATATASSDGLMSSADKSKLDAIGSVVTVSGTTPVITAVSGVRYVCGEVATLDFTPCATGVCDVVFTSGSTPTIVTLPNTVKFPDGAFTAEANKTYEINVLDGVYGVVMAWT